MSERVIIDTDEVAAIIVHSLLDGTQFDRKRAGYDHHAFMADITSTNPLLATCCRSAAVAIMKHVAERAGVGVEVKTYGPVAPQ